MGGTYRGPVTRRGADQPEVYRITGAPRSHTDDLNRRVNRYLISMAIRTACVVLVFVVSGPLRWVFAAGAVFLPYIAVVFANASDRRHGAPLPTVDHRGLSAGPADGTGGDDRASTGGPAAPKPVILEGHVVAGPKPPPDRHD
jgi:hypothetical protein